MMMRKLCAVCILFFSIGPMLVHAQPVDNIIGVKRAKVQQILRPYRILDYQRDKVAYHIDKGIRQTVLYATDTCTSFLWAVNTEKLQGFITSLEKAGYVRAADGSLTKDGLVAEARPLESGKATVFTVRRFATESAETQQSLADATAPKEPATETKAPEKATSKGKKKNRTDRYDNLPMNRGKAVVIDMPLMQQEAQREKANPVQKVKDPTRNWVGDAEGSARLLGWD